MSFCRVFLMTPLNDRFWHEQLANHSMETHRGRSDRDRTQLHRLTTKTNILEWQSKDVEPQLRKLVELIENELEVQPVQQGRPDL